MSRRSDVLALGSFVVLGLPDGILGTAWPSMRATFGAPVGDLGLILLLATAGSVLVTDFVGSLIQRLGVPALLSVAGLCAAVGVTGYALAPGLGLVLGASVLSGAPAGMTDAGLNTAIALTGRLRLLNLLYGAYGADTAIGPLVVTAGSRPSRRHGPHAGRCPKSDSGSARWCTAAPKGWSTGPRRWEAARPSTAGVV